MTTNNRNFGKQAGDPRSRADHRLVLCSQAVLIKSVCGGDLPAADIRLIFVLPLIRSRLALTCAIQPIAPTIVAGTVIAAIKAHRHRAVVWLAVLLP